MPGPTKTLVEVESSDDNEKTRIFSNPKPKPYSKPGVCKTKGTGRKTNPPKEKQTSIVGPTDKEG